MCNLSEYCGYLVNELKHTHDWNSELQNGSWLPESEIEEMWKCSSKDTNFQLEGPGGGAPG